MRMRVLSKVISTIMAVTLTLGSLGFESLAVENSLDDVMEIESSLTTTTEAEEELESSEAESEDWDFEDADSEDVVDDALETEELH